MENKKNKFQWKPFLIRNALLLLPSIYGGGIAGQILSANQQLDVDTQEKLLLSIPSVVGYALLTPFGWIGILLIMFGANIFLEQLKRRLEDDGTNDDERNFKYSDKGTYGTSGWMLPQEQDKILNMHSSLKEVNEVVLGKDKLGNIITVPADSTMNKNIAVFGASGTGKSRAFARNYILQAVSRVESMIITDPKGELFESTAPYLRANGYDVKVFNLVNLRHSDSWNCLAELNGDDLRAQIFTDVIIQNTDVGQSSGGFWSDGEMNLLKALCIYVERSPALPTNMGEVYNLVSASNPAMLDRLFDELPFNEETQAAKSAYNIFRNAPDNVRGGIIIGLGSRLQVFQSELVRKITSHKEINITKPATEKCAYFCITSDQHSAFDFLAVLFYAMLFIKLVEFADLEGGKCPVPVNFILDEFPNIGSIPDFCKKISTVRSRGISISVIFQNLAQLQNRYPHGQWEEILGNCDTHLFLGCTDKTTAEFISDRTGIVTVGVSSKSHDRYPGYTMLSAKDYKENSSVGKRTLLTPDEVLRLQSDEELILLRGQKPLKAYKYDYSLHPEAASLTNGRVADYVPEWMLNNEERVRAAELQKMKEKEKVGTAQESYQKSKEEEKLKASQDVSKTREIGSKPTGFR